jgi:hypothetical protein
MRQQLLHISFTISFGVALLHAPGLPAYSGSSFTDIESIVFNQAYPSLPQYQVNKRFFGDAGKPAENHLAQAARRSLTLEDDIHEFPQGQKLLQANGICFAGKWIIEQSSAYTGQFRFPVNSLVIARASVSLGGTRQKDKRAFGMALKIFPVENPDETVRTLNAFVMHSMSGTRTRHVLDLVLDNEPPLGGLPPLSQIATALRLQKDLEKADEAISEGDPDIGFRPVEHLAVDQDSETVAPRWLRLKAPENMPRIDKDDFRDELRVEHYPGNELVWLIDVAADTGRGKKQAEWLTIGKLVFNRSITSPACDQRLHFKHPPLKGKVQQQ